MADGTYHISLPFTAPVSGPYNEALPPDGGTSTFVGTVTVDATGNVSLDAEASYFFELAGTAEIRIRTDRLVEVTGDTVGTTG